jgi:aspartyl-tRNA(Asn)/glutamyl-tRNA(Gln) amidotransferase subunit B
VADFGLTEYDAGVLTAETEAAAYFEAVAAGRDGKQAANWVINELFGRLKKDDREIGESPVSPAQLGAIIDLIAAGRHLGQDRQGPVRDRLYRRRRPGGRIVEARGMRQVTDTGAIEAAVDAVIAANPDQVEKATREPQARGLVRGAGDEGHGRQGEPEGGQRSGDGKLGL